MLNRLTSLFCGRSHPKTHLSRVALEKKDGKYVLAARERDELDQYDKASAATETVNQTVDLIREMQVKARSLDNTEVDANPWKGEVAIKGMELGGGGSADITVAKSHAAYGYEFEARLEGPEGSPTYIQDRSPFSKDGTQSSVRELTFQIGQTTYLLADKDAHEGYDTSFLTVTRD